MKSEAAESFRHGSREESGQLYFVRRHKKYRSKRHVACSDVEYRNTIDANWAKDEDSAFTNLYLDLQLIPTRRFRLAQPKDPKGV